MKMNDNVYKIIKWIVVIVLPALATFYIGLAQFWPIPYPEEISGTIMLVNTLLGSVMMISTHNYNKSLKQG